MASNCRGLRAGCVEKYMIDGGPVCWSAGEVRAWCGGWDSSACDDCKEEFCRLSPKRPSPVMIAGKEYNLCALCQKPYAVHRAHWTYDTLWSKEKRRVDEHHHARMHDLRVAYEANIARRSSKNDAAFE